MYHTGELIKFSPFVFKNGNQPKPKYCIVLGQINDTVQPLSMASRWMNMSRSIWTRWVEWLSG